MQRRLNRDLRRGTVPAELNWDYAPTERQAAFHRSTARYRLYGGAMGGGKTWALCAEAIALSLRYPGNRGYMCRNQLIDFRRSTLVTFDRVCPPSWLKGHYRDDRVIEFRNGSAIVYGGLGGEEDLERIKSTEFGWFAIDEATETLEDMFLLLCSRLRWKLTSGNIPRYYGILASNPEPGWVKERFVDQTLPDHEFFPALPRDNPFLPPDYDKNLRILYPDEWVKRYLDGSWDVFEGQIYKEFDRALHVYSNIEISRHWPVYRIIDHGYNNPTCCLWIAIDYDNRAIIFDEYYERFKTIKENAAAIRAKHPDFHGLTLCDPSMFSRTMQREGKAWSPADEYRSYGITCVSPYRDDNWVSEGIGINLVKQRLKDKLLTIHKDCKNTIKEIIKYRWRDLSASDKGEKAAPEIPVDVDNHAMDCLRYFCVWRPASAMPPKAPEDRNSWAYYLKKLKAGRSKEYAGWN